MAEGREASLIVSNARRASHFLKTLANEDRLLILCTLVESEKSVSELEAVLGIRQPTLSQQLARLRAEDLVTTRRNGKSIYYALTSTNARAMIDLLYKLYCAPAVKAKAATAAPRKRPSTVSTHLPRQGTRGAAR